MSSHPRRRGSKEYPPDFSLSQSSSGPSAGGHTVTANVSSGYKNVISSSDLIHPGSPAVYQLRPKKEEIGTLTRLTVGERNPNKPNRTILLLGETGTGKSTLINALINYSMGVKWEDGVWFQVVEEKKRRQAESQTSDVIVYEIFGFEDETLPYSLTIIDTPGYGDTTSTEHNDMITRRLLDLFRSDDRVHEVHAVGLVMKSADSHLSDRQIYILSSMMSLFGRNLEKNIVALITHSVGVTPDDALKALEDENIKCAKSESFHFLFDNQQKEERTEENEFGLEAAWRVSERGMNQFTAFLERSEPQNLMKTTGVVDERNKLTECVRNLTEKIKLTELKQREIKETLEVLKKHKDEMKKNENFTVKEVCKDKQPIDGGWWVGGYKGATCCKVCEETCHYPGCTVCWNPKDCEVMDKYGRCTVCTRRCPASDHVKEKWRYVTGTKTVQKTLEEMKEKFEKNKSESENKSSLLENLQKEMNQLRAEQKQFLYESYQHVIRLEQIALKADAASTIVHLDFLIEKMKEEGDTEKVQKLEKMRSREYERIREALRDMFGKMLK